MLKVIFDSNALITCCKFLVDSKPLIEHILGVCEIFIPDAVSVEVSAAKGNYPDAAIAERMIKQDKIKVRQVTLPTDGVLDHYKLGTGEKEAIVLGVEMGEVDFITSDDRIAYIVMRRMRLKSMLLLDLLLELRERKLLDKEFIKRSIGTVRTRYSEGFVYHSLRILEEGDRRCLK